jgi:hypothetical protein
MSAGSGGQRGGHAFDGRIAEVRSGEHSDVSVYGHSGEPGRDHPGSATWPRAGTSATPKPERTKPRMTS